MYTPDKKILENYADVLVNFALGGGNGIKKGESVYMVFDHVTNPLGLEVYKKVLEAGGNPILKLIDPDYDKVFFETASDSQLEYFPEKFSKGLVDDSDHYLRILCDRDPLFLQKIPADKIIKNNKNRKKLREWMNIKEDKGIFTWTLCLFATEGMAHEAGLSLEEYWEQIIKACFLDLEDPISKWKEVTKEIHSLQDRLNALPIDKVHVEAEGTDLWLTMGEKRKWMGGSGRNIPSFELFTSPDWRGTNGHIYFNQPLYRYGNLLKDVRLEFKDGVVINATASENEKLLKEMIAQKDADKVGEFSLTDKKFSRINKFMAETLFDENFGGEFGNTHIALGESYHDCYSEDPSIVTPEQWAELGYNTSAEHCDIISASDRKVTAVLKDGSEILLYEHGEFKI